jgi:hypothetical protein
MCCLSENAVAANGLSLSDLLKKPASFFMQAKVAIATFSES